MKKTFLLVFLTVLCLICLLFYQNLKEKPLYILFENSNECSEVVKINFLLNDSTYSKELIYSDVTPHYNINQFNIPDGDYSLIINVENIDLREEFKFHKQDEIYLFVNIVCKKISKGKINSIGEILNTDSVYKKEIIFDIKDEMPFIH